MDRSKLGTICEMHYCVFGTDGVSLQVMENYNQLTKLGYNVVLCGFDVPGLGMKELNYQSNKILSLRKKISDPNCSIDENRIISEISEYSLIIKNKLIDFFEKNKVSTIHVRNVISMPLLHLPFSLAMHQIIKERKDLGFLIHHHDFEWEGPEAINHHTKYKKIRAMADQIMATDLANTRHVVINSLASHQLKLRKGIDSQVIPDGFNFEKNVTTLDISKFKAQFGFNDNDLLIGMMARVRTNKAMQIAIQYVSELQNHIPNKKIYLVITQSKDFDHSYYSMVEKYAKEKGVQMKYIGDYVVSDIDYKGEQNIFPFYSTYQAMDLIVYPPIHEGFGNQAIEAAWAKKLLVMHLYPVAEADIIQKVKHVVPLGRSADVINSSFPTINENSVKKAVQDTLKIMNNKALLSEYIDNAYEEFRELCDIKKVTNQYINNYQLFWK